MRKVIIGGSILLGSLSAIACTPPQIGKPLCISNVVVAGEYQEVSCDVTPPQRLDIEMSPEGDQEARCNHMGGKFIARQDEGGEDICQGVDY